MPGRISVVLCVQLRPYYTMHCFTCVLDVSKCFHWRFGCFQVFSLVLETNLLVSQTRVKMQEKCEKISQHEKNARLLHFFGTFEIIKTQTQSYCNIVFTMYTYFKELIWVRLKKRHILDFEKGWLRK